jgi:DNA polymerase-3 subunit epsilon
MREIVIDTETTGLDPFAGDRMVEVGCVELVNHFPTGKTFHSYFNPERDMPEQAQKIHGLTGEFLKNKPLFGEKIDELLAFLGEDQIVAHNASFDFGFLNAELERAGRIRVKRERMVDTLLIARRKHPGAANRLDDLCARYGVDNSRRSKHGALLDAELLAEVYVELLGARQAQLGLGHESARVLAPDRPSIERQRRAPLPSRLSAQERAMHRQLIASLGDDPIWRDYLSLD